MEIQLNETLSPLFSDRVFPDIAPLNTARPYCTYAQVGGRPFQTLKGGTTEGVARVQINVWADSRIEASALIREVETTLTGEPLYAGNSGGAESMYESEQELYGSRQDFLLKY